MKREDIKKIFPDATEEQLKGLLDINTADIGKAKGELEAVKADLEKANGTLKEYETTIADMKKSAEGNEDFKKKFEELEQRIADEKAEAEKKAKEEAEEAEYSSRFKTVVGEQKWRDALTEKAVYAEFKTALQDETNKGRRRGGRCGSQSGNGLIPEEGLRKIERRTKHGEQHYFIQKIH